MKIIVDENIPLMTVEMLRQFGHNVLDIRGTPDEGMPDSDLWSKSQSEGRLMITTDKGFSKYRYAPHYGIPIICLKKPNRAKIHQRVIQAMTQFEENEWNGFLVVMRDVAQTVWRSKP
jgi:predicted nuclease of predicted toxin-antitoxin system